MTRPNTTATGELGNGESGVTALSADGTKILFSDTSTNLDPRADNDGGSYIKDLATGSLELVSVPETGVSAPIRASDLSAKGSLVMLSTNISLDPADADREYDGYLKAVGGLAARNPTVVEGSSGNRVVPFTITLSRPVGTRVTVGYGTRSGTATAGQDYVPTTGRVSIPAGLRRTVVLVTLLPDSTPEADETFTLTLSAATGAGIQNPTATATIADDD